MDRSGSRLIVENSVAPDESIEDHQGMVEAVDGHGFDESALFDLIVVDINVNDWVAAVMMQRQRLQHHNESMPTGEQVTAEAVTDWIRRVGIDARLFVLAMGQLAEAATALRARAPQHLTGDIDDALARFNNACPDLRSMRNAIAHWGQHLLGRGHRQEQAPHLLHEVFLDSMILSIDANHPWLEMNFECASTAAMDLGRDLDAMLTTAVRAARSTPPGAGRCSPIVQVEPPIAHQPA